jgi:hypothetical protein
MKSLLSPVAEMAAEEAAPPSQGILTERRSGNSNSTNVVLPGGKTLFTRKIAADDEQLDFNTAIKISSKMKLRRTEQARSPGTRGGGWWAVGGGGCYIPLWR